MRIDLHGMTLAQAYGAVQVFLAESYASGVRRVEIVTGKGSGESGSLRYEVPRWLEVQPWASRISSVSPAPTRQGGVGALRVVFKKRTP